MIKRRSFERHHVCSARDPRMTCTLEHMQHNSESRRVYGLVPSQSQPKPPVQILYVTYGPISAEKQDKNSLSSVVDRTGWSFWARATERAKVAGKNVVAVKLPLWRSVSIASSRHLPINSQSASVAWRKMASKLKR